MQILIRQSPKIKFWRDEPFKNMSLIAFGLLFCLGGYFFYLSEKVSFKQAKHWDLMRTAARNLAKKSPWTVVRITDNGSDKIIYLKSSQDPREFSVKVNRHESAFKDYEDFKENDIISFYFLDWSLSIGVMNNLDKIKAHDFVLPYKPVKTKPDFLWPEPPKPPKLPANICT